jgi:PAS domain S-box-containing protein
MGTFDWDVHHDRFAWSPWHDQLWGFMPGEFDGSYESLARRVHPADLEGLRAELTRCIAARELFSREFRVVWADGSIHWIAARGEFDFDERGRAFRMRGAMMEITAHKTMEERLCASEARLEAAQALAHLGDWELDLSTMALSFSREMFRLLNRDAAWGVPRFAEFLELVHPEDRAKVERAHSASEARGPRTIEYRTNPSQSPTRYISSTIHVIRDESGRPLKSAGTSLDITQRVKAEMASRQLAAIVESSEDAIISTDLNDVVTSWNNGAERLFGFTADEMAGTSSLHLVPVDLRERENEILRAVELGKSAEHYQSLRCTRNARSVHVSVSVSPIKDAGGRIVGASTIARDITALREREDELSRMSRLYAALSQVNQAIVRATTREDLFQKICMALVQQGGFCLTWISWHEPDTHRLVPVAQWGDRSGYLGSAPVYTDDRPEGRGPTGRAFRDGRSYVCNDIFEDPAMRPWRSAANGRGFRACAAFPIHVKGEPKGTLTVYAAEVGFFQDKEVALLEEATTDVSFALDIQANEQERRRTEAVARSEKRFSDTMLESMPGVLYFYDEHGRFLRWNRQFEIVSGYSREEIARMHPLDFFPLAEKPELQRRIAAVFEKGESSLEASFMAKDGSVTPHFFTGKRVFFDGSTCLVGVGIDISERKRAEVALRELNETLETKVATRTDELRAALARAEAADRIKSAFLANMSHELRTPLNSIIGFTGILLQGLAGALNSEQDKQLGMVRASARHLLELINDVLDLSKIEANQLDVRAEPFDLGASVERVIAAIRPLAERKGLALTAIMSPALSEIVSDRRRVEQILLNLLGNAVKFTEHGSVTLKAELEEAFRRSPTGAPAPAVRLRISDTGIGIAPQDLATLFQPFRQIDTGLGRVHEGTGLGLAICRRLAGLLAGEIVATSELSKGSDFTLTLPLKRGTDR